MPRDSQQALWSMILGIAGLICCGIFTGIPAIILAVQAKREIASSGGMQTGEGMATAGLVLGIMSTAFFVLGVAFVLVGMAAGW